MSTVTVYKKGHKWSFQPKFAENLAYSPACPLDFALDGSKNGRAIVESSRVVNQADGWFMLFESFDSD